MALILNNVPDGFNPDEAEKAASKGSIENAQEQEKEVIPDKGNEEQQETVVVEGAKQPDEPEEPTDNKVRSKLGREVAALKEANKKLTETVESLLQSQKKDSDVTDEGEEDPDRVLTVRELREIESKKADRKKQYDAKYLLEIQKNQEEDGEDYAEIYEEWQKNHNVTYTNFQNPIVDARLAYNEARTSILKKKLQAKTTPFKKTPTEIPQKPTVPTTKTAVTKDTFPELSDDARNLAAHYGWDVDKVRTVLGGQSKVIVTAGGKT